jgi:hypothetical protein
MSNLLASAKSSSALSTAHAFAPCEQRELHVALTQMNRARLTPGTPNETWNNELAPTLELARKESAFLERERRAVASRAALAPSDAAGLAAWFDALKQSGPGQYDPLFDFLAERASFEQVRWFVRQEVAGEAGFDDLVALTQLRMPVRAKLEFARNYSDEMGRGKAVGMHGPMLARLAEALAVSDSVSDDLVWESLALGNLLVGLAYNRRYAFHAVGALGVIELTAPTRAVRVVEALDRLGVEKEASYYFRLHATVDISHARTWRDEILIPLVSARPELAVHIAEGALMRLNAGARTFDRYRREFGLRAPQAYLD